MLNTYLLDVKEYQAAAVLRLWYATYCYTQVENKKLRVVRARKIVEKFFDRCSERSERLPWNVSSDDCFVRKLRSLDVLAREKDAIILQIKRAAFYFLERRIKCFDGYQGNLSGGRRSSRSGGGTSSRRGSSEKKKTYHQSKYLGESKYDDVNSMSDSIDGGMHGMHGMHSSGTCSSRAGSMHTSFDDAIFRELQQMQPNYDLSLRLSDLSINLSQSDSSRISNESSTNENAVTPTTSSSSSSRSSLSSFTPPTSSAGDDDTCSDE